MIHTSAIQEMGLVARSHHIGSPRFYPLAGCTNQTDGGASATYVSMYYISRTWSWAKATIWLPSPPTGLTIHIEAQVHGEPRGACNKK